MNFTKIGDSMIKAAHAEARAHNNPMLEKIYLPKYFQNANMEHEFAYTSHKNNNYAESARHLQNVVNTFHEVHQVLHYNLGGSHPATQDWGRGLGDLQEAQKTYEKVTGSRDNELADRFSNIMLNNNLNDKQFGD